jgi:DNA repair photolyase
VVFRSIAQIADGAAAKVRAENSRNPRMRHTELFCEFGESGVILGQLPLFGPDGASLPRSGAKGVEYRTARTILTPATGFMQEYDFTLNPYAGCAFGCTYCYAAFFARDVGRQESWGEWVEVKENAVALLRGMRRSLSGKSIYLSSVTDPYQPVERSLELVRAILHELVTHQPRLVVQTRSPLVTRDVDVLSRFERVRVNMTVTTDSERVRRVFEPQCPPNEARLEAARTLVEAGLDVGITMTPLLPLEDPERFAEQVCATGAQRFVVQPMHVASGRFVAGTRDEAVRLTTELGWDDAAFEGALESLRRGIPSLVVGRDGFGPP